MTGLILLLVSCNSEKTGHDAHKHSSTYTCPMHPQIVQEEPGTCPVCSMDLVPVSNVPDGDDVALSDDLQYLLRPVNSSVVAGIRTVVPQRKQMPVQTAASGTIIYDTRRSHSIPVRFGGRIEKLYVNYNFQPVRKGQKILEIYSPEIVTAQKELLYLLESDPGNSRLIAASRQKLRLLGLTEAQISRLKETGSELYSLAIYSPYSGYIYEESAAAPTLQTMEPRGSAGNAATALGTAAPLLDLREGMYLKRGQGAFKVINTDRVWAEFNIYPEAVSGIKKGDPVTIVPDFRKDQLLEARVDLIQPFYKDGENFQNVRVYLDNPGNRFRPGQLVTARFQGRSDSAWWIPSAAVLDLGTKKVAFVKQNTVFHPQIIHTGRVSGNWTEVTGGLSAADTIAHDGHYLVDSEGFVEVRNKERNLE